LWGVGSLLVPQYFEPHMASQPHQHSFLALDPHGFHRVAYSEWGNPRQHRVVICVHGLTRNCRDFDSLAAALAGHFRVVCMDVVGRGASDWLEHKEDYGFGQYLSDAASLLALVAHEKRAGPLAKLIRRPAPRRSPFIDWIGTSMGGLIGMMLAARSNSPIRRLVLNDVGPFISWQALARLKKLHRRTERFDDLREVQEYIRDVCAEFGPLSEEQWAHVTQHSVQPSEDGGYELAWDPAILNALRIKTPDRIAFGNEFLLGFDLWPIWYAVRCPTLVLRGSKSAVLSAATAKRMRKSGPRAKVIDIDGVGHAPWLMSEDQIKIVRDFLLSPDDPA
jgi:pimeloyl-ACP methyl ester carboxylesterase